MCLKLPYDVTALPHLPECLKKLSGFVAGRKIGYPTATLTRHRPENHLRASRALQNELAAQISAT